MTSARHIITGIILLTIQGCSIMDVLDFVKPSSGISVDTEIVAGDKEIATEVTGKKETTNTTNTAESITQTYNTIQQGKSIWDMFLMMLMSFLVGWLAMPDSIHMWSMAKSRFKRA